MTLTYLFTAHFMGGKTLSQTPDDTSTLDPQRSCFYDVLHQPEPVVRFCLTGQGHTYTVDLRTGQFTLDGEELLAEGDPLPPGSEPLRLIYYRQHRHAFNRQTREELSHAVTYVIGWQTTRQGRNYQQEVRIA